jgi:hypothetical protein
VQVQDASARAASLAAATLDALTGALTAVTTETPNVPLALPAPASAEVIAEGARTEPVTAVCTSSAQQKMLTPVRNVMIMLRTGEFGGWQFASFRAAQRSRKDRSSVTLGPNTSAVARRTAEEACTTLIVYCNVARFLPAGQESAGSSITVIINATSKAQLFTTAPLLKVLDAAPESSELLAITTIFIHDLPTAFLHFFFHCADKETAGWIISAMIEAQLVITAQLVMLLTPPASPPAPSALDSAPCSSDSSTEGTDHGLEKGMDVESLWDLQLCNPQLIAEAREARAMAEEADQEAAAALERELAKLAKLKEAEAWEDLLAEAWEAVMTEVVADAARTVADESKREAVKEFSEEFLNRIIAEMHANEPAAAAAAAAAAAPQSRELSASAAAFVPAAARSQLSSAASPFVPAARF